MQNEIEKNIQAPFGKDLITAYLASSTAHGLHICSRDIIIMQMDHFGNPESGGIHDCKHGFVFDVIDSVQQMVDFIGSQAQLKLVFLDHTRNHNVIPKDVQDIPVKKADGGNCKDSEW